MRSVVFALALGSLAFAGRASAATAYDSLAENYAKWKALRPARYAYSYQRYCFCSMRIYQVEAEGDSVVQVTTVPTEDIANPQFYSPDSIFARIVAGLDAKPYRHDIRYNASLGYPEMADFDPLQNVADEEYAYLISRFEDRSVTGLGKPPAAPAVPDRMRTRDLLGRARFRPGAGTLFHPPWRAPE